MLYLLLVGDPLALRLGGSAPNQLQGAKAEPAVAPRLPSRLRSSSRPVLAADPNIPIRSSAAAGGIGRPRARCCDSIDEEHRRAARSTGKDESRVLAEPAAVPSLGLSLTGGAELFSEPVRLAEASAAKATEPCQGDAQTVAADGQSVPTWPGACSLEGGYFELLAVSAGGPRLAVGSLNWEQPRLPASAKPAAGRAKHSA